MLSTEERPPVLRFEKTAEEDRVASDQAGKIQYKDVVKVYIRCAGDMKNEHVDVAETTGYDVTMAEMKVEKDVTTYKEVDGEFQETTEKVILPEMKAFPQKKTITPWIDKLKDRRKHGRISENYFNYCMDSFERFKKNEEDPINGTPLAMWSGAPESVKKKAIECGIRSVEDAAAMTSEAISHIGMGASNLKQSAIAFLAADKEPEEAARKMVKMEEDNASMKEQLDAMAAKLAELDKPKKTKAKAA